MPKSRSRRPVKRRAYLPAPPKKKKRTSPKWYGWALLGTMAVGVASIVLNYMGLMPGGTQSKWLWGGLGLIALGFAAATQYR